MTRRSNGRRHRETGAVPAERLAVERRRLHVLPSAPCAAALGETRSVNTDQAIRFGSVRYSTLPGLVGAEVWVRASPGTSWSSSPTWAPLALRPAWPAPPAGLVEVARHALSTPGRPGIELAHYPDHPQDPSGAPRPPAPKPTLAAEAAFLALGPGAEAWLVEAAAAGAVRVRVRVRAKMAAALELAALVGRGEVYAALGTAAAAGRFAEHDLLAIVRHRAAGAPTAELVVADETHSARPGTAAGEGSGRGSPPSRPPSRPRAGPDIRIAVLGLGWSAASAVDPARPHHHYPAATVLDRLALWLSGAGEPAEVAACAAACFAGT